MLEYNTNIIHINSIRIYLRTNLTAQGRITELVRVNGSNNKMKTGELI
jgi:hypothetical protein